MKKKIILFAIIFGNIVSTFAQTNILFLHSDNQSNQAVKPIELKGFCTIDGNGYPKNFIKKKGECKMMIHFLNSNDIHLKDVTHIKPAAFKSGWLYCNEIVVDGIKIISCINHNGDGIGSKEDFESVTISNCTFHDIHDSSLKTQINVGSERKNMIFSNIVMQNVPRPFFMTYCQQKLDVNSSKEVLLTVAVHGFTLDNQKLNKNSIIFLTRLPNYYITDFQLNNIQMTVANGSINEDGSKEEIKEYALENLGNWWLEFSKLSTLPAFDVFVKHINVLYISNYHLKTINEYKKAPIVFENVLNSNLKSAFLDHKEISSKNLKSY